MDTFVISGKSLLPRANGWIATKLAHDGPRFVCTEDMLKVKVKVKIWPRNWLPWQRPLSDRKMNERLMKTSRENLVKISPVDSEITG